MGEIRFGTDGWRAVIAEEFTFANVRLAAQAIAQYMAGAASCGSGLVIGYDKRFLSGRFAVAVAEVMAGNGIPVWMTGEASPTPVTTFAVRAQPAAGGVMITAGHNPPEYNGIKFIPEYAGPAVAAITGAIEEFLDRLTAADVRYLPFKNAVEAGLIRRIDPKPAYLAHLRSVLKFSTVCRGQLRVVIDPVWGAGIGYLEELLQEGCSSIEVIHGHRDLLCGGQPPEPAEACLDDLKRAVTGGRADLGLALDGDAGRFGVIDRDGSYLTPGEIICLLLHYLTEYRNWRGAVARTVATTHMIDRIAEDYGLPVVETPVGFKHVGQSLIRHRCILGAEESGGLSIQGHIPEKDGILALALVVEMVSSRGKSLRAYQEEVRQKFGRLVGGRLDVAYDQGRRRSYLERLQEWSPRLLAGRPVVERKTADGVKLILEDGSWVLARVSGTRPLFRIYAEAPDPGVVSELQASARRDLGV